MKHKITIHICNSQEQFAIAKSITQDYIEWLGMDLSFQNIHREFEVFDAMYAKPMGSFVYATLNNDLLGGVAIRKLEPEICEMKRLFVYSNFQGNGVGKLLCDNIISIARDLGYSKIRLDTVAKLESAIGLYKKIGFYEIDSYCPNPDPTVKYMELEI